jgi:hypothetical protein
MAVNTEAKNLRCICPPRGNIPGRTDSSKIFGAVSGARGEKENLLTDFESLTETAPSDVQLEAAQGGPEMIEVLLILGMIIGFIAIMVVTILGAVKLEGWRQKRSVSRFGEVLEGATVMPTKGPGAWSLVKVSGRRAGCEVVLEPDVMKGRIDVGQARMRRMGIRLVISGEREVGRGRIVLQKSGPIVDAEVRSMQPATLEKLAKVTSGEVVVEGRSVRICAPLPMSAGVTRDFVLLIDALGPWLCGRE